MRIGLFADVHANREALEACLYHAMHLGLDQYVFLGDLIGYGADPGWVIDTVMRFQDSGALVLLGNHDEAVLKEHDRSMNDAARAAIEWTRSRITPTYASFLAGLPLTVERSDLFYVHANAWAPGKWGYITEAHQARQSLAATLCRFSFCGHVHEPALYYQGVTGRVVPFIPTPGVEIPLGIHRRWLIIPGSVGQPRDGNPAACYAIFDKSKNLLTYYRVPYDVATAANKIFAAGLPEWLGIRLEQGV